MAIEQVYSQLLRVSNQVAVAEKALVQYYEGVMMTQLDSCSIGKMQAVPGPFAELQAVRVLVDRLKSEFLFLRAALPDLKQRVYSLSLLPLRQTQAWEQVWEVATGLMGIIDLLTD